MQLVPGHMKGDGAYVLARQPDYIVAGFAEGQPAAESKFVGDQQLAALPGFARCYQLETVTLPYSEAYAQASSPRHGEHLALAFSYYRRTCPHT